MQESQVSTSLYKKRGGRRAKRQFVGHLRGVYGNTAMPTRVSGVTGKRGYFCLLSEERAPLCDSFTVTFRRQMVIQYS